MKTQNWREELFELSEKYCKHDDRDYNSCLFHIFEPFIKKVLDRQKEEIEEYLITRLGELRFSGMEEICDTLSEEIKNYLKEL